MSDEEFYEEYLPRVLREFLAQDNLDEAERHLPAYDPFLGGSRYSLSRLTGSFTGLDLESTRDEMLLAVVKRKHDVLRIPPRGGWIPCDVGQTGDRGRYWIQDRRAHDGSTALVW